MWEPKILPRKRVRFLTTPYNIFVCWKIFTKVLLSTNYKENAAVSIQCKFSSPSVKGFWKMFWTSLGKLKISSSKKIKVRKDNDVVVTINSSLPTLWKESNLPDKYLSRENCHSSTFSTTRERLSTDFLPRTLLFWNRNTNERRPFSQQAELQGFHILFNN